ncbi:uncharacterized protein KY384_008166 [Bacidia gigantensis]|uniref:uncharacterized protein n=1 Tax=Bacidia gigantensis TaxID=2732470 RepID=UPI001D048438|nr:uncharacterized protein KY384_008166 [Bacidia gigantensis]KAG8526737.1 hypothetical protein KY384_008166 [Bacidia gigantensis]
MPLTKAQNAAQGPPAEVNGDMKTDGKLPTKEELKKLVELDVFDVENKAHKFKTLLQQDDGSPRRTLIIFIRHFFCGVSHHVSSASNNTPASLFYYWQNCCEPPYELPTDPTFSQNCQEYTTSVSSQIPPSTLASLSQPTSIVVIGCGSPILMQNYIDMTGCPYPIYADPTTRLYKTLRLGRTLNLGNKSPQYMQHTSIPRLALRSIWQELRSGKNLFRGGDYTQVGGEFLFEPSDTFQGVKAVSKVSWCKRMRNTRGHAEISELKNVLGITAMENVEKPTTEINGETQASRKRWSVTAATSGFGRRLSKSAGKNRMSWHAGAGKQPSTDATRAKSPSDKEAEQERQVLEQLKEDNEVEGEEKGADDAFDKLTKKTNGTVLESHTNGTAAEGKVNPAVTGDAAAAEEPMNGHAVEGKLARETQMMPEEQLNGHAIEGRSEATLNGTTPEEKLNGHAIKPSLEPLPNGVAPEEKTNGHAIKSKPHGSLNGAAINGSPNDTGLWSKIEKTANGAAINGCANGHVTA